MENYKLVNIDKLDFDLQSIANKIRDKSGATEKFIFPSDFINKINECTYLDFSIVGSTSQPDNPIKNMVWVNTSNNITKWIFSATTPVNPIEGMIWIEISNTSPVNFDMLKDQGIMVYPTRLQQYIDGNWVEKIAKIYLNNEWTEWSLYLYNQGDSCTEVSSGWYITCERPTSYIIRLGSKSIEFQSLGGWYYAGVGTYEPIDLTGYNKLKIQYNFSNGYITPIFGVTASRVVQVQGDNSFIASAQLPLYSGLATTTIDIKNIDGGYITINGLPNGNVYKIWLE